jgi:hypothetical protein
LLRRPGSRWMLRYVEMDNAAPLMGQNDHDKQSPEGCGRNGKEIGGYKVFEVIVEEGFPRLGRGYFFLGHHPRHRSLGDVDPEFQEFPVYPRSGFKLDILRINCRISWPFPRRPDRFLPIAGYNARRNARDAIGQRHRASG